MISLNGKTAVITGGSKGLGRELIILFAREDCNVATIARSSEKLKKLKAKFESISNRRILTFTGDLTDVKSAVKFCKEIKEIFKSVDIIINNAGFNNKKALIEETDLEELNAQFNVHAITPFLIYKQLIQGMKKRKSGHIVNILSDQVRERVRGGWTAYCTTKHAEYGLGRIMLAEAAEANIKVTNAIIGGMETTFRSEPRPLYLKPKNVAKVLIELLKNPKEIYIPEIVIYPHVYINN